jgi:dTDP-4-amino-4,6-dideoxygalactose transaminase
MTTTLAKETDVALAINGGPKAVTGEFGDLFTWPIITPEDEEAVLAVLRAGKMSGTDVTEQFEREMAAWHGVKFALAHNNGTAALHGAMFGCGVGRGDEVIGPSMTYWASLMPALSLGATIVFAETDPSTLCIDPGDLEQRITKRTKAIVAVHYAGHPCEMDEICRIARKHGVKVIEDVSHAQGALYKGRLVGTIGDVAGMSLMSGKSLVSGEGGMLLTNDRNIFERAAAFGHYERTGASRFSNAERCIQNPELQRFAGLPLGGFKYRMHQLSSALGRVQLKHYPARIAEIQSAMNRFWDSLEGVPGIRAHRPPKNSGSTMGGWYAAHGLYVPEELHGLKIEKFCEAVRAEGIDCCSAGANNPLHLHPLFYEADIYGDGKPTVVANATRDVRSQHRSLPRSESIPQRCFGVPWFKHDRPETIRAYAAAYRKVALAAKAGKLQS